MVLRFMMMHGLAFALVANAYLLLVMVTMSPRIWGYVDYPEAVRAKVSPQTKQEKLAGAIVALPWILFVLSFPVFSTFALRTALGSEIPFLIAFLNPLVLLQLFNLSEVLILDWLVISKITPSFVIIPGSTAEDYKDMSHHYRAHARASAVIVLLSLVIGAVVSLA